MRILLADDHPFTLQGTKSFLESKGYREITVCNNGIAAWNNLILEKTDLAILDINMPGMDGIDLARKVLEKKINTRVVLITMHNEISIFRKAMEYGVYGYILKENAQEELSKCLKALEQGKPYESATHNFEMVADKSDSKDGLEKLNHIETKVLELISKQKRTRDIAEMLFLSEKTIEGYRSSIIEKLGLPKEKNILLKYAMIHFNK